jgi:hypothetical protein
MKFALLGVAILCVVLCAIMTWLAGKLRPLPFAVAALATALIYGGLWIVHSKTMLGNDVLVLAISAASGRLLGAAIRSRAALVAFSVVAATVDIVSFAMGPTHDLITSPNVSWMLRLLAVIAPCHGHLFAVLGIGDLLVFAGLGHAMRRLGMPWLLALGAPGLGLVLAVCAGLLWRALPAMPLIAATTIIGALWLGRRSRSGFVTAS